jgi:hypothetical protein
MTIDDRQTPPPLHFEVTVGEEGRLEIVGPFRAGQRLTVLVIQEPAELDDLAAAASSSLGFWDNPLDDEDWNDPTAG